MMRKKHILDDSLPIKWHEVLINGESSSHNMCKNFPITIKLAGHCNLQEVDVLIETFYLKSK